MLYWSIHRAIDGEATVEITSFTSGLSWSADYISITDPGETQMDLTGYIRVFNNSGEEYENAQVRLVVGTINLVEKIAELAKRRYGKPIENLAAGDKAELKQAVTLNALYTAEPAGQPAMPPAPPKPKEVEKEGLGEYFIYTVEGTETIPNGWSKRMLVRGPGDPVQDPVPLPPGRVRRADGPDVSAEERQGIEAGDDTPLPDGVVRVYRDNGKDGLGFRVQQGIKYVPIGDDIELNLGPDPEVIHEWVKLKAWQDDFWFQAHGVNVFRSLEGEYKIEVNDTLAGWEDHTRYVERIRNSGQAGGRGDPPGIRRSRCVRQSAQPDPRDFDGPDDLDLSTRPEDRAGLPRKHKQGYLAKQQNVTLEAGD